MTREDRKKLIIYSCCFILGASLLAVVLGYAADYSVVSMVIYITVGILVILASIYASLHRLYTIRHAEKKLTEDRYEVPDDRTDEERLITKYFNDYGSFEEKTDIGENDPLQDDTTQLFYNMQRLHHSKLQSMGIRQKFRAAKRRYVDVEPYSRSFFDGNYVVTEKAGQIEAVRNYYFRNSDRPFLVRRDRELAHTMILRANMTGDAEVRCPGCGCTSTRKKLLDGCDYCGTKFVVNDLDSSIAAFALRDDADLAYAKYKDKRIDRAFSAFYIAFVIIYILVYLCVLIILTDPYEGGDEPIDPLFGAFVMASLVGSAASVLAGIVELAYLFIFCPVSEIWTAAIHSRKKQLENIRRGQDHDIEIEKRIREYDPLFSIRVFYLGVQNKISSLIYSLTAEQIGAFSTADLSGLLKEFENTFDHDIISLSLDEYSVDGDAQRAAVTAQIKCCELHKKRASFKNMMLKMKMKKSVECRTQSLCAPYVLRCRNCGDSLSLERGLLCPSCGTKADLFKYDWVIESVDLERK